MKKLFLILLCGVPLLAAAQQSGKVFVDVNRNGVFDKGEPLLKGVAVSDGLNVVQTDQKGCYRLSGHERQRFVFITTPSGYKTLNAYYHRVDSTDRSYDFALIPYNAGIGRDGSHSFIHISDTEIGRTAGNYEWTASLRDYAANQHVAFIIHTGDICYKPGLESHIKVMNSARMPETQVFYGIGNHDLVSGPYGEAMFESIYGPSWYSFDVGNIHYIVTPMYGGDYAPSYHKKDVYAWIANDLKTVSPDKSVYIFNHSIADDTENFRLPLSATDYVDLPAHNLKAWLYGHWHVNHIYRHPKTGVYSICTSTPVYGGIDHASSAFRVMHIDAKGDFTSELRYSYINKSVVIASINGDVAPVGDSGAVLLSVNAYDATTPAASLRYTCLLGGKQVASGNLKQNTDFNWAAEIPLPSSLSGQYISLLVEAQWHNGDRTTTRTAFCYNSEPAARIRTNADWTNLLGNATHTATVADNLTSPRIAWTTNLGSNIYMASPLVKGNNVYAATIDDNQTAKASLVCLDAVSGRIKWRYSLPSSVRNNFAVESDKVLVQDVHGVLYAVDAANGRLCWKKDMNIGMVPALNDGLVAKDGIVYAGTGKSLGAYRCATGEQIWQNTGWNRGEGCTSTLSLNDDNILIGHAHWGALYANDATTGKTLWGLPDGELRHRSSTAAMHGGVLYLVSAQSIHVIDAKTGVILSRRRLGYDVNVATTPLVTDTEIIFGTSDRGVVALDRESLADKWNFRPKEALILSAPYISNHPATVETAPVLAGNTVFIGASDGTLYALNRQTSQLEWSHPTGAPIFSAVAVSGNAIFFADFAGNVYGLACDVEPAKK